MPAITAARSMKLKRLLVWAGDAAASAAITRHLGLRREIEVRDAGVEMFRQRAWWLPKRQPSHRRRLSLQYQRGGRSPFSRSQRLHWRRPVGMIDALHDARRAARHGDDLPRAGRARKSGLIAKPS
jgi:hypothetical protein